MTPSPPFSPFFPLFPPNTLLVRPRQVFGKEHIHGVASDFWALGVTAYELLHAERPYHRHCPHLYIHYLEDALKVHFVRLDGPLRRHPGSSIAHPHFRCACGLADKEVASSADASFDVPRATLRPLQLTERLRRRAMEDHDGSASPVNGTGYGSPASSRRGSESITYSTTAMNTASAPNSSRMGTAEASHQRLYDAARRGSAQAAGVAPTAAPSPVERSPQGSPTRDGGPSGHTTPRETRAQPNRRLSAAGESALAALQVRPVQAPI